MSNRPAGPSHRIFAPARAAGALAVALAAQALAAAPLAAQQQPPTPRAQFAPREERPEQFPDGRNREDTFYFCTACHGFAIVSQQGMSRNRWDESMTFMTERHKMPKLEGEEREKILDYLAHAFPERGAPGGWRNPFIK